ncbi:DMT family transporter [Roseobacter sp.]|uniref:DMT family transporter n=1 Tax=Roseobacter sp. TaxID=1907202 RepID=UPI002966B4D4|nr:DMT family transporter [Roseobacter sp.]MDW3182264.1 DMT family transporter [Roseobacter sp.]
MNFDRPLLGIMLMLGFCILAPVGDAIAKILGETVPVGQLVLVRFAIQAIVLIPLVLMTGRKWRMRGRILTLTFLRTLLHILGIGTMVTALKYLPLADAVAIAFVMPFIMLILGKYFLKEEVGARRLIACLVGFLGTLLVVQPSFREVGWPALLPVAVALNFAFFMLLTRQIARETDPIGLQAVSGLMAVAVMVPALLWFKDSGIWNLQLIAVDTFDWTLLVSIGLLGTIAHLLMTWSLRYAPSTTLAPMQYLEIPFATVIGFLVFGDLPNNLAAVGILITIAAGLYVVLRERATARTPVGQPNSPQPLP